MESSFDQSRGRSPAPVGVRMKFYYKETAGEGPPFSHLVLNDQTLIDVGVRFFHYFCRNKVQLWLGRGSDRKSTRLNSSHSGESRMPSSA